MNTRFNHSKMMVKSLVSNLLPIKYRQRINIRKEHLFYPSSLMMKLGFRFVMELNTKASVSSVLEISFKTGSAFKKAVVILNIMGI